MAKATTASRARRARTGSHETKRRGSKTRAPKTSSTSKSSLERAKWIDSPDQHADRPGQTLATTNHEVIRRWADERGAKPAMAPRRDGRPGALRLDFPDYTGERLKHISWDDWFRIFNDRGLVFIFQERLRNGRPSNFFKLDNPRR